MAPTDGFITRKVFSWQIFQQSVCDAHGKTSGCAALCVKRVSALDQLIYPLFIAEGLQEPREITSMPGIMQWPIEHIGREVERITNLGIPAVLLFGIPSEKDEVGSQAYATKGIIQQGIQPHQSRNARYAGDNRCVPL